ADERLRSDAAHPVHVAGRAERKRGLAVPCVVPAGAARAVEGEVGEVGYRAAHEGLLGDGCRPEAAQDAARELGAVRGRARCDSEGDLMLARVWLRLRAVVWQRKLHREMREEMAGHIEQSTSRLIARGLPAAEARR